MAKRHLAGMRPGSSAGVKFDEDDSPGGLGQLAPVRPNTSQSPRTKSATSNAWHDVMEMCRKAFTSKMHSVGNEILQDVRGEVQRAVGTLREEIGTMLEAREHTANQQLESLLDQIKHLRQTTEESVMNIQLDLSPVLQEIQRLDGQHSEARQRHEQQLEKMLQHLSQARARAEMDEEKLQRLQERQDHTEGLLCSVQTGQEMLAVSLERAAEEVQKSRAKSHEDHTDMMLFSSHASQRIHERLQEPVHVDFGEVLRELRKNQLATTSDTRTMLGEIGKIQQALHLDFIQMAEYVREESQKRPSVVAVEAVEVDPPELEVEPISKELHVSGAKSLGVVDFLDKEPPKLDRIASTPAPPEKDGTRSVPNEVVSYKRGSLHPSMHLGGVGGDAAGRAKPKRVREFWSQTEPPPLESTAIQTDPVKFENKKRTQHPTGQGPKAKPKKEGPPRAFQDAEALKQKARSARVKPQYNVFERYHKTGCAQYIARHWMFEYATLVVVCANTVWIAIDTDLNTHTVLTNAGWEFQVAENFFCGYFFGELLVRFCAFQYKRHCLQDFWFSFDLVLVSLMVLETWALPVVFNVMNLGEEDLSNALNVDLLRILRLVRILRLSRMAKLLRAVPELVIIIKGIGFAARSVLVFFLLWSMIIYVFAIVLRQATESFPFGALYFSTVTQSMTTLFLSGIVPGQADLIKAAGDAHWSCWLILVAFVLLASVTIMYMLVGVLVEVMTVISSTEKEGMTVSHLATTLRTIMQQLNYSTEVPLSQREFQNLLLEEEVERLLGSLGVDVVALVDTADVIYEDMTRSGKSMTFENMVDTFLNLRGRNTATVKDVKEQARVIKAMVNHTLQANGKQVMEEFNTIRAELALLREEALRRDESDDEDDLLLRRQFSVEDTTAFTPGALDAAGQVNLTSEGEVNPD
ncbi:unnamed protein product [Effrenium voratum]|nr:unnamed protein product [Effrenium voratum]